MDQRNLACSINSNEIFKKYVGNIKKAKQIELEKRNQRNKKRETKLKTYNVPLRYLCIFIIDNAIGR